MNEIIEKVILDEYELYYVSMETPNYIEEVVNNLLGFQIVEKNKYTKNGKTWILDGPAIIRGNNCQSIFTFSKEGSNKIPLYFSQDFYLCFISNYCPKVGIIEYTNHSLKKDIPDLIMLKDIKDDEIPNFEYNKNEPKQYSLNFFSHGGYTYTHKENKKSYFIGLVGYYPPYKLYRIEEIPKEDEDNKS